jgi:hypothetical protein
MDNRVRWFAFAAIALVAAGVIFLIAPQSMPGVRSAEDRQAEAIAQSKIIDCTPNPHFEKFRGIGSDWQSLTRQRDGSRIEFNPFTIACNPENGHRDIWIQILRTKPQQETFEDETTIETISFTRDRYLYRIDCAAQTYAMLERRIMGDAPEDAARVLPMTTGAPELQPIQAGGIVKELAGPACARGRG